MSGQRPSARRSSGLSPAGAVMGRRVGPYELVRELGRGGMGVVYLARQPGLERHVAVKLMHSAAADPTGLERFRREAQVMARLRHPAIVGVLDLGEQDGWFYLVMDYVDGRPLSDLIGAGVRLPAEDAFRIGLDLARALAHAHTHGVVHRDLKPGNVLLRERDGQAMLTDFGLAADRLRPSHLTQDGFVVGTPQYMAPEQATGQSIDGQADVFSLGVILFELLTGTQRAADASVMTTMRRVAKESIPPPSRVNPTLDRRIDKICLHATARDRGRRYPGAQALADDIQDWLDGRSGRHARKIGGFEPTERFPRPRGATEPQRRAIPVEPGDAELSAGGARTIAIAATAAVAAAILGVVGVMALTDPDGGDETVARLTGASHRVGRSADAGGDVAEPRGVGRVAERPGAGVDALRPEAGSARHQPRPGPGLDRARALTERAHRLLGDPDRCDEAATLAGRAAEAAPDLAEAWVVRARAHLRRDGDRAAAREAWDRALELRPELVLDFVHHELRRGDSAARGWLRGKLDRAERLAPYPEERTLARAARLALEGSDGVLEALEVIEPLVLVDAADPRALLQHVLLLWSARRFDEALARAGVLVAAHPDEGFHHCVRGRFLRSTRRWAEAEADLARARELRPDLAAPLVEAALLASQLERREQAVAWLRAAVRLEPDAAAARAALANVLVEVALGADARAAGSSPAILEEALAAARRGGEVEPLDGGVDAALAWVHRSRGEAAEALARAEAAVAKSPDEIEGYDARCMLLQDAGRFDEAEAVRGEWREATPDLVHWNASRGTALFLQGAWGQTWAAFDEARRLDPDDRIVDLWELRLLATRSIQGGPIALRRLRQTVARLDADAPELFARWAHDAGEHPDAIRSFPSKIALRAAIPPAKTPTLQRAYAALNAGDITLAEKLFIEADTLGPPSPLPHTELVTRIYLDRAASERLGRPREELDRLALEHARTAVANARSSGYLEWLPLAFALQAKAEMRLGESQSARTLEKAVRKASTGLFRSPRMNQAAFGVIQHARTHEGALFEGRR